MHNSSGIYQIRHVVSGKIYVGSAVNIKARWGKHRHGLRSNNHHSLKLQRAWNKYGELAFVFEILEECLPYELVAREQYYIDTTHPFYNISQIAGSLLGTKRSQETKDAMSLARKGKPRSPAQLEHLAEMSRGNKGRPGVPPTQESRERARARRVGKRMSDASIAKMKTTLTGRAKTEEHRTHIGDALRGKKRPWRKRYPLSIDTRRKICLANTGRKGHSPSRENIEKMRIARVGIPHPMQGKKHSAETREKMRQKAFLRWARERALMEDGNGTP